VGKISALSNTMLLEITLIFRTRPRLKEAIAASKVAARIRSFSASRS
jgi:hypothetical protein